MKRSGTFLRTAVLIFTVLFALLSCAAFFGARTQAAEKRKKLTGVDVSDHNGYIDWAKAKKGGIDFAIIRIGWGDNITSQDDSYAKYNMQQCEKLGIPYGVYIYSYALTNAAVDKEVEHMIRMANGHTPSLGYWFDMEDADFYKLKHKLNPYKNGKTLTNFCVRFLQKMKAKGYENVGVYANPDYFDNVLNYKKIKEEGMIWLAHWDVSAPAARFPCEMWQYSAKGKISGGKGVFDMNIIYSDSYLYGYAMGGVAGRFQRVDGIRLTTGDLNLDGLVNSADFEVLKRKIFSEWKIDDPNQSVDLNRDGTVNLIDLALLKKQTAVRAELPEVPQETEPPAEEPTEPTTEEPASQTEPVSEPEAETETAVSETSAEPTEAAPETEAASEAKSDEGATEPSSESPSEPETESSGEAHAS